MEILLNCLYCGKTNIVDFENLSGRPLDKITTAKGYSCSQCTRWEAVFFTSISFEESMRKLHACDPLSKKYQFLLSKALRKQISMRERGEQHGFQFEDIPTK